jgi:hypothetical protein
MNTEWNDICEDAIEYFKERPDDLTEAIRELDYCNNFLVDRDEVNEEMDYLSDMYYDRPLDLIRDAINGYSSHGGDFDLDQDYFYYDSYGWLVSIDEKYNSDEYSYYLDDDLIDEMYRYRDELWDYLPKVIVKLFKYWESVEDKGEA